MVAMSVCEAELMEGSTCALLLESTQAMLREVLPEIKQPSLYIDNMAAHNILNGSTGSWRTRHLRIRHSYVLDQVSNGNLRVCHLAGEDQPGDLPTKLHSRARLMHLLTVWNMVGLPALDGPKAIKCLRLGCLFVLLLAVQSLAVAAEKEPLQVTGTGELALMLLLTCISAVALWEAARAVYKYVVPRCFGTKKSRRMQRLRDLARAAAEAEIEKWAEQEDPVTTDQVARTLRGFFRRSGQLQGRSRELQEQVLLLSLWLLEARWMSARLMPGPGTARPIGAWKEGDLASSEVSVQRRLLSPGPDGEHLPRQQALFEMIQVSLSVSVWLRMYSTYLR